MAARVVIGNALHKAHQEQNSSQRSLLIEFYLHIFLLLSYSDILING